MADQNDGRAWVLLLVGEYLVQHEAPCLMPFDMRIDTISLQLLANLVDAGGEDVPEATQEIDIGLRRVSGRRFGRCLCRAAIERKCSTGKQQTATGQVF